MSDAVQILFFLEALLFLSVIFMHLSKKNSSVIYLYAAQSLVVAGLMLSSFFADPTLVLLIAVLAVFAVKVLIAPYFFTKLIKDHQLTFSASTYLNTPMTLIVLAMLTVFTYSRFFDPLASLSKPHTDTLLLAIAMVLASIFLIINRKGALSQMVGILSLENAIVSFAFLAGLEQSPGLQLGIMFDIALWVVVATVFASMVYRQFGSLDVTIMKHLNEE